MRFIGRLARGVVGPRGRRSLLVAALAVTWAAWAVLPPSPAVSWRCPAHKYDNFKLSPDGGSIVHAWNHYSDAAVESGPPRFTDLRSVLVCDAATGIQRFKLSVDGDSNPGWPVFSPDGSWMVVEDQTRNNNAIRVVATSDGQELTRLLDYRLCLAISPDSSGMALMTEDESAIHIWNISTRNVRSRLRGAVSENMEMPDGSRFPAVYSADGRRFAAVCRNGSDETNTAPPKYRSAVIVWDVSTGRELARRDLPPLRSINLKFGPDGRRLACVWENWRPLRDDEKMRVCVPGGRHVPDPCSVALWDVGSEKSPVTITDYPDRFFLQGLQFSRDGRWLVLQSEFESEFWDTRAQPPTRHAPSAIDSGSLGAMDRNHYPLPIPHSDLGVLRGNDLSDLELWNIKDLKRRAVCHLRYAENEPDIALSPDGKSFAVRQGDGAFIVSPLVQFLNDHLGWPTIVQRKNVIQLFDTTTGAERAVIEQDWPGELLGFSANGQMLWTTEHVASPSNANVGNDYGIAIIRGWSLPIWRPPIWLFAVTAAGLVLLIFDWPRGRRLAPRSMA